MVKKQTNSGQINNKYQTFTNRLRDPVVLTLSIINIINVISIIIKHVVDSE